MKCVYEGSRLPNGFEEQFDFSPQMPYTISIKHFADDDEVPLHYADTIEILMCEDLSGWLLIDDQRFTLSGQQVFVIPPYTVHANSIRAGKGVMYVMKINLTEIGHYLNLQHYLELCGCRIDQLAYTGPEFTHVNALISALIENDGELSSCLPHILMLFKLFSRFTAPGRNQTNTNARPKSARLQELISWTQTHFADRITIEQAARLTGYSKYHFCTRFKSLTGMTYLNYVNSVRIAHACLMLRDDLPISHVCRSCGFESVSYFTQVFRRLKGMTPGEYAAQSGR